MKIINIMILLLNSTCFVIQEPNKINFEDLFYAKVLENSISDIYLIESREIPDYVKTYHKEKIIKDAKFSAQQYPKMLAQWSEPNLLPADYQDTAYWILSYLELNEKKLLTFGVVSDVLGVPDSISFAGYCSDESGTIASELRFFTQYEQREVELGFTAAGFCYGDTLISSDDYSNVIRWPQDYSYSKQFPILHPDIHLDGKESQLLIAEIKTTESQKKSFYDWVSYMQKWPGEFKVPNACYDLDIMMIDQILDDLVIVYLKITHDKQTLFCDTWWKKEAGKWVLLNDEQVTHFFEQRTMDN